MLYFTCRTPFRQCRLLNFDYLEVLFTKLYTRNGKKSQKIKKKSHCPVQKSIQFVHDLTTVRERGIYVTPVYLDLRSDLDDLEHPPLICTSLLNWPKPILRLVNDRH